MKLVLMLTFLMLLVSCGQELAKQQGMTPKNSVTINESSSGASPDIAYNGGSDGEEQVSGGTGIDATGIPGTTAPVYIPRVGLNSNHRKLRLKISTGGLNTFLHIAEIKLRKKVPGVKSLANITGVSSSHPQLFDGLNNNFSILPSGEQTVIEFSADEPFNLREFRLVIRVGKAYAKIRNIYIESYKNDQWENIYTAMNLSDSRADYFIDNGETKFVTKYTFCPVPSVVNHLSECTPQIVFCSDLWRDINNVDTFGCEIRRKGIPVYCYASNNPDMCSGFLAKACTEMPGLVGGQNIDFAAYHNDVFVRAVQCTSDFSIDEDTTVQD